MPNASRISAEPEVDQFTKLVIAAEQLMLVTLGNYLRGLLEWRLQSTSPSSDDVDRIRRFVDSIDPHGYVGSVDVECADAAYVCRITSRVVGVDFSYQMVLDKHLKPTFSMIDRMVNILFGYYAALLKQHDDLENALEGVFGTSRLSIEPQSRSLWLLPDYPHRIQMVPEYIPKT